MMRLARAIWKRLRLRNLSYSERYGRIESLYRVEDPWSMNSEKEQARFNATNELIEREFGRVDSLLEIGCGEGHQSEHLSRVTARLTGIDVSKRAVARASKRCPAGSFSAVDFFSWDPGADAPYTLVTACEVIYYMRDIPAVLKRLRELGKNAVITFYEGEAEALTPHLDAFGTAESGSFSSGGTTWHTRIYRF